MVAAEPYRLIAAVEAVQNYPEEVLWFAEAAVKEIARLLFLGLSVAAVVVPTSTSTVAVF